MTQMAAYDLLNWYQENQRSLPWRQDQDPYHIWVSEIMLQQTQVKTVIPYYLRFIQRFPSIEALALAPLEEVYQLWEGLGYYSRARNLHAAAGQLLQNYGGKIPKNPIFIKTLPGIGDYTTGAIASIAFGFPYPAVDGNVQRVISRYLGIGESLRAVAGRRKISDYVTQLLLQAQKFQQQGNPQQTPGQLTQGLMELGALICTPLKPQCTRCPWYQDCTARQLGYPEAFPLRLAKKPKPLERVAWGLALQEGQLLLKRRPPQGIWGNLWTLPGSQPWPQIPTESLDLGARAPGQAVEPAQETAWADLNHLLQPLGLEPAALPCASLRHVFTHKIWQMDFYSCLVVHRKPLLEAPSWVWVSLEAATQYPMPAPIRQFLKLQNLDIAPKIK